MNKNMSKNKTKNKNLFKRIKRKITPRPTRKLQSSSTTTSQQTRPQSQPVPTTTSHLEVPALLNNDSHSTRLGSSNVPNASFSKYLNSPFNIPISLETNQKKTVGAGDASSTIASMATSSASSIRRNDEADEDLSTPSSKKITSTGTGTGLFSTLLNATRRNKNNNITLDSPIVIDDSRKKNSTTSKSSKNELLSNLDLILASRKNVSDVTTNREAPATDRISFKSIRKSNDTNADKETIKVGTGNLDLQQFFSTPNIKKPPPQPPMKNQKGIRSMESLHTTAPPAPSTTTNSSPILLNNKRHSMATSSSSRKRLIASEEDIPRQSQTKTRNQRSKTISFGTPPSNSNSNSTSTSNSNSNPRTNSRSSMTFGDRERNRILKNVSSNILPRKSFPPAESNSRERLSNSSMSLSFNNLNPVDLGLKVLPLPHSAIKYSINKVNDMATNVMFPNNLSTQAITSAPAIQSPLRRSYNPNNTNLTSNHNQSVEVDNTMSMDDEDSSIQPLNNIEYAKESKNVEFHNIFKDTEINDRERLITDHGCALSRDILLQGRLYISDQHLAFYSNILGWITTIIISFKEIVQIEKKFTVGIFPNAISVDTLHSKYIFASFLSRDSLFNLITNIWNQVIINTRVKGLKQNDDDNNNESSFDESSTTDFSDELDFLDEGSQLTSDMDLDPNNKKILNNIPSTATTAATSPGEEPTLGPTKHEPTVAPYTPESNEKLIKETVFQAPMGQVFNILFGNDSSKMESILKVGKNYDITPTPIPKLIPTKTRDYQYIKPLTGSIGPNKTRCIIKETLDNFDLNQFIKVTQFTSNPDVPSGNVFKTRTTFIFTWNKDNSCKLAVYTVVQWSGRSFIKGPIENGTIDGVTTSTDILIKEVNLFLSASAPTTTSSKKHNEIIISLPTRGPAKHPATELPPLNSATTGISIVKDVNFKAPLGTTFEILFGNDTTNLNKILKLQNNIEISEIPNFHENSREYSYIKKLNNSLGPKQTKCNIKEIIENLDLEKYILVKQITRTPDVPSGSSFTINSLIYLNWGRENSTNLNVFTNIVWTSKSFLKNQIEKGSIDGQKSTMKILVNEVQSIIENATHIKGVKSKRRTRGKSATIKSEPTKVEEPPKGHLDSVLSLIKGMPLPELTATNILLIISGFIFFMYLLTSRRSSDYGTPNIVILPHNRIDFNGNRYTYVPRVKTLYEIYGDERMGKKYEKDDKISFRRMLADSQGNLWDWINDRGNESLYPDLKDGSLPDMALTKKNIKDLKDTIEVAELQLQELNKVLDKLKKHSNTLV